MEKKQINRNLYELFPRIGDFLNNKDFLSLLTLNKRTHSECQELFSNNKKETFKRLFSRFVKKKKNKLIVIDNVYASKFLKQVVLLNEFKELNKQSLKQEKGLMGANIYGPIRDPEKYKIYNFQDVFYLMIKRCTLDSDLNITRLNGAQKNNTQNVKYPRKEKRLDKMIEDIDENLGQKESYYDKKTLLERHKRLQLKIKGTGMKIEHDIKNQFKKDLKSGLNVSRIGIILSTCGDFTIAVFDTRTNKEIFHTSDHKYVMRKKGGGIKQSKKDKVKSIKSMGANIRRANEKKHTENIGKIINQYYKELKSCQLIVVNAPGDNMLELKTVLKKYNFEGNTFRYFGDNLSKAKYSELLKVKKEVFKGFIYVV